jgi:hypothetical protein
MLVEARSEMTCSKKLAAARDKLCRVWQNGKCLLSFIEINQAKRHPWLTALSPPPAAFDENLYFVNIAI